MTDFAAALRTAKERGTKVLTESEGPVCTMALLEDTEGNQLLLPKRKPGNDEPAVRRRG